MSEAPPPVTPPNHSLSARRGGCFALLRATAIIVPMLALALGGAWSWTGASGFATTMMLHTLDLVTERTLRALDTQDAVLAAVDAQLDGVPWDRIATDPALHRLARRLAAASTQQLTLSVISPDGHLVVSSETDSPPSDMRLSDRDYVRALPAGTEAGRRFVSEVVVGRVTGHTQLFLARGRHGADGRADGGVLTAGFTPAAFEQIFSDAAGTPTDMNPPAGTPASGFMLLREDGSVLARFPRAVTAPGEQLAANDPLLAAARTEGAAGVALAGGLAVQRVGGYGLLIAHSVDPAGVGLVWAWRFAPLAAGALVAAALLLVLTARAQRRATAAQGALNRRAVAAEHAMAAAEARAELEARMRRFEKVAALGHLSAGAAHDFNNLLQSILISAEALGQPDLAAAEVPGIGALILRVGERGLALTNRMMEYGRRDELPGGEADVAASLQEVGDLLAGSFGPTHRLHLDIVGAVGLRVRAHPAEFEMVILNLATNARDAMPGGGDIAIGVTEVEETRPRTQSGLTPGRYLCITVIDTGPGMAPETLERAGEALFTTRPRDQGAGFGFAMARGFARRAGGKLVLASAEGRGATIRLWLPAA